MIAFRARATVKEHTRVGRRSLAVVGGIISPSRRSVPGVTATLVVKAGLDPARFVDPYTLVMPDKGGATEAVPISEYTIEVESWREETARLVDVTEHQGATLAALPAKLSEVTAKTKRLAKLAPGVIPNATRARFKRLVLTDWEDDPEEGTVTLTLAGWDSLLEDDWTQGTVFAPVSMPLTVANVVSHVLRERRHFRLDIPHAAWSTLVPDLEVVGGLTALVAGSSRLAQALEPVLAVVNAQLYVDYEGVYRLRPVLSPKLTSTTLTHPTIRPRGVRQKRSRSGDWATEAHVSNEFVGYTTEGAYNPRPGTKVRTETITAGSPMQWALRAQEGYSRRGGTTTCVVPWTSGLAPDSRVCFPYNRHRAPDSPGIGVLVGTVIKTDIDLATGETTLELEG